MLTLEKPCRIQQSIDLIHFFVWRILFCFITSSITLNVTDLYIENCVFIFKKVIYGLEIHPVLLGFLLWRHLGFLIIVFLNYFQDFVGIHYVSPLSTLTSSVCAFSIFG